MGPASAYKKGLHDGFAVSQLLWTLLTTLHICCRSAANFRKGGVFYTVPFLQRLTLLTTRHPSTKGGDLYPNG